jgi:TetR/AcrR family transcriptional regulator, ethionamide resistance regulator
LLEERSIAEISVDDLAKGAGLSRPTFYFYFPSKDAVLFALFDKVINEADAAFERHNESLPETADRYEMCRAGINVFFETFVRHRAVTRAAQEVRSSHPEVRELLAKFMKKWIDNTAAIIEVGRAQGSAPTTLPAHDLATALNLMNERALFGSFADEQPAIARDRLLDTLVHIWVTSIYGESR